MDNQQEKTAMPVVPKWLLACGTALILGGTFIALFVAREALNVYRQWNENAFTGELIAHFSQTNFFIFGDKPLVVTEQGAVVIALSLFILMALLGIHIATALIRTGAHIVSPAFPFQLAQLKLRIEQLRGKAAGNRDF